jgi:DNA-binding CsgD family transcriptional regulator
VVITGHGDVPMAVDSMKKGAMDFIQKPFNDEELVTLVERMLEHARGAFTQHQQSASRDALLSKLTGREAQVLERIVAGRLNKQIADDLGISIKTVEAHRANIMEKLNANTVADLLKIALGAAARGQGLEAISEHSCISPTPAQAGVFTWKIETDDRPTDRRQRPRQNHPRRSRRPHRRAEGPWREPGSFHHPRRRRPGQPGLHQAQGQRQHADRPAKPRWKRYPADLSEADLLARIRALNDDPKVHGILVQLPLAEAHGQPEGHRDHLAAKDVDGFHVPAPAR